MKYLEFRQKFPKEAKLLDDEYHGFSDGSPFQCEYELLDWPHGMYGFTIKATDPVFPDPWFYDPKRGWVS
jgi:hypothetical protein